VQILNSRRRGGIEGFSAGRAIIMVLPLGNLVLPLLHTMAIENNVNQIDSVTTHAQNSIPANAGLRWCAQLNCSASRASTGSTVGSLMEPERVKRHLDTLWNHFEATSQFDGTAG